MLIQSIFVRDIKLIDLELVLFLLFLLTIFDVIFGLIIYFISNRIAHHIKSRKALMKLISWTLLFPISVILSIVLLFISTNALQVMDLLQIIHAAILLCFLFPPYNIPFLGIWIIGALLSIYKHTKAITKARRIIKP